ncbi:hypothetical protein BDV93DRAFT_504499 [Ceratobasidium sp. AG-I]|nr:hypothetical protein BDV93DRAFT_504499 [Ceratobasidium sp. AG-I]
MRIHGPSIAWLSCIVNALVSISKKKSKACLCAAVLERMVPIEEIKRGYTCIGGAGEKASWRLLCGWLKGVSSHNKPGLGVYGAEEDIAARASCSMELLRLRRAFCSLNTHGK